MNKTGQQKNYNIYLIGFMGTGKSTIAKKLKKMLSMDCAEMDEMIVENQGMPISEIFEKHGESYFRDIESATLAELQKQTPMIVSCGGGVVMRDENAKQMKAHGYIVLLTAKPETIYERVKGSKDRPILNNNMNVEYIANLMEKRRERYLSVADVIVETDGKTIAEICAEIIANLPE